MGLFDFLKPKIGPKSRLRSRAGSQGVGTANATASIEFESICNSTGTVVSCAAELSKALEDDKPLVIVSDSSLLKELAGMFARDVRLIHERAVFNGPKGEAIFAREAAP